MTEQELQEYVWGAAEELAIPKDLESFNLVLDIKLAEMIERLTPEEMVRCFCTWTSGYKFATMMRPHLLTQFEKFDRVASPIVMAKDFNNKKYNLGRRNISR